FFAAAVQKYLIKQFTNRGLFLINHQLLIIPLITKTSLSPQWLTHLCPYRYGCRNTAGNFFAFPFCHGSDNSKKQPTSRSTRIYLFGQRNQISPFFSEYFRKL